MAGLVLLLALGAAAPVAALPGNGNGPPPLVSARRPAHASTPGPPPHAAVPGPPPHAAIPETAVPSTPVVVPTEQGGAGRPDRNRPDGSATGSNQSSTGQVVARAPTVAAVDGGSVVHSSSTAGSEPAGNETAADAGTDRPSPGELAWAPGFALDGAAAAAAVAARDLTIPILLLVGVGLFLVLNGRAGGRDPRLVNAPLRARGSLRFPSAES